ncbi:MAG: branched-chain amino acid ABC transporter permease [Deltaproteobacteria bacterium]|nr:branched-chain amino acid ABC transporter permease [Deltaproteobacteria bacterium]
MVETFLQQVANGVTIGVVYSLIAIGLTLIFGILGVINFAQGEFYMLGGYMTFTLLTVTDLNFFVAMALSMLLVAALGVLSEYLTVHPLIGRHAFILMLSTLGLSIFLANTTQIVWGPDPQRIESPLAGKTLSLGGVVVTHERLFILGCSVASIVLVSRFIRRTRLGTAMRAVARDAEAAALMGIDVRGVYAFTFAFGAGLAALAGTLLGALFGITPFVGEWGVIKAFSVVIMGGMGNVQGAIWGGLILGIAENLGAGYISTGYKDAVGYAIIILVLLFRPQGLFGGRRTA